MRLQDRSSQYLTVSKCDSVFGRAATRFDVKLGFCRFTQLPNPYGPPSSNTIACALDKLMMCSGKTGSIAIRSTSGASNRRQ